MCRKLLVDVTLEVPGKLIIAELLFAWRCFDTLKSNVINYCFTFNLLLSVKIKLYLYKMAPEQDRKSGGKEVWLIPKLSNSHKELTQGSTHWEVGNLLVLGHWTKIKRKEMSLHPRCSVSASWSVHPPLGLMCWWLVW